MGIDWATRQHQICVLEGDGAVIAERQVAHSGAGIADLCAWLHELSGGHPERVHAGIEVPHGAVVEMLLEREVQVYAINPKQMDRFRDRFTASGAKDDRRDARVLADSLRTDRRSFRQLQVQAPPVIELREWSRLTAELQEERNGLINRMREQLRRYYPQMIELGGDLGAGWVPELWEKAPTPAEAARVRKASVAAILFAEASQLLAERDYRSLRILTGVAPVTKRSGKSCKVSMRRACNQRLSNAMYHWARVAIQHDPVSRERYAALRARGQRHGRALRTVADRLLAVACAMLRDRTQSDPQHRAPRPLTA